MCGRFTLSAPGQLLFEHFQLEAAPELSLRYNIAPTQPVAIIRTVEQRRILDQVRWGLIPSWATDPSIGNRLINARAETVAEKPAFRAAFAQRRCLIPADGFYEWLRKGKQKQPYHFHMLDRAPFAFAGLWEQCRDKDGTVVQSCTIITTTANELVEPIHERMPVILQPRYYDAWLDPQQRKADQLLPMLRSYPAERMEARAVASTVNSPLHDAVDCLDSPA